ncbi:MAG TPA: MBL fold metallo-hydrolase RNA specificity domain-containing protein [Thermoanaerobaculia bacterium]
MRYRPHVRLFQCDPDIRLARSEIYLDPAEPRRLGIISHGHSDHIGRHGHFVATAPTAAFIRIRQGDDLRGTELPYRTEHLLDGWTVSLHPAGHVLGSSMIRVQCAEGSLLYTGDFRLAPSYTAEPAEVPEADAVIMESTYGSPEWVFPSRESLREQLLALVQDIAARGKTAVLLAYSLGKAQEVAAMLRDSPVRVVMHSTVARISEVYEKHGVDLGKYEIWTRQASLFGHRSTMDLRSAAVIVPPHMTNELRRIPRRETVALTGWALHGSRDTDHALPLSDHADFHELLDFAEQARAKTIFVTHGSKRFAEELRRRGMGAEFLRGKPQMKLF